MKPQKWKAILLCLALVVGIGGYVTSRKQFGPDAERLFIPLTSSPSNKASALPGPVANVPAPARTNEGAPREEVVGVGLMLRMDNQSGDLLVAGLVPNSPATEAGLAGNLRITKIDDVPTVGMNLRESVERLRGATGTKVRLEVHDLEGNETRTVELTRRKLQL